MRIARCDMALIAFQPHHIVANGLLCDSRVCENRAKLGLVVVLIILGFVA